MAHNLRSSIPHLQKTDFRWGETLQTRWTLSNGLDMRKKIRCISKNTENSTILGWGVPSFRTKKNSQKVVYLYRTSCPSKYVVLPSSTGVLPPPTLEKICHLFLSWKLSCSLFWEVVHQSDRITTSERTQVGRGLQARWPGASYLLSDTNELQVARPNLVPISGRSVWIPKLL